MNALDEDNGSTRMPMTKDSMTEVLSAHLKHRGLTLTGPAGALDTFAENLAVRELAEMAVDAQAVPELVAWEQETTKPIPIDVLNQALARSAA